MMSSQKLPRFTRSRVMSGGKQKGNGIFGFANNDSHHGKQMRGTGRSTRRKVGIQKIRI